MALDSPVVVEVSFPGFQGPVGPITPTGNFVTTGLAYSTYYPRVNPSGYTTLTALQGLYYPISNPVNYMPQTGADSRYYQKNNPSGYATGLLVNKSIYVDSIRGSDITALIERFDKPFQTLSGAQAAARTGDIIRVFPGVYSGNNLGQSGVNWYFYENAIVNPGPASYVFQNTSTTGIRFSVDGYGKFIGGGVVKFTGSAANASSITLNARYISGDGTTPYIFTTSESGTININVDGDVYGNVVFANSQYLYFQCRRYINSYMELYGNTYNANLRVFCDEAINSAVLTQSVSSQNNRVNLYFNKMRALASSGGITQGYLINNTGGKTIIHNTVFEGNANLSKLLGIGANETILHNCTILGDVGYTGYAIDGNGTQFGVINTLTINAGIKPGITTIGSSGNVFYYPLLSW